MPHPSESSTLWFLVGMGGCVKIYCWRVRELEATQDSRLTYLGLLEKISKVMMKMELNQWEVFRF